MKTIFGGILIFVGIVSIFRYPNLGVDMAETLGALMAIGILAFLPGVLLIRSGNKDKTK